MIKYIVKDVEMIRQGFSGYESDYLDSYEDALEYVEFLEHIDKEIGEEHHYTIEEVEVND